MVRLSSLKAMQKIRAFFELARVSNLPTVLSSCLAGYSLGGGRIEEGFSSWIQICVAVGVFYVMGMLLNDYWDYATDLWERPRRPLPSGRITRRECLGGVLCLITFGLLWVRIQLPEAFAPSVLLLLLILAYNWIHLDSVFSSLLMAGCRFLIYPIAAVSSGGSWQDLLEMNSPAWLSSASKMGAYVFFLSHVAKWEMSPELLPRRSIFALSWVGVSLWMAQSMKSQQNESLSLFALSVSLLWSLGLLLKWILKSMDLRKIVGGLLAGICLWDGVILAQCHSSLGVWMAWGCFLLTLLGHRLISGT